MSLCSEILGLYTFLVSIIFLNFGFGLHTLNIWLSSYSFKTTKK